MTSLDSLAPDQTATVTAISGEPGVRRRLLEMGLVPGTGVRLVRRAPLGDPLELRVRGYHLSLRSTQAAMVSVTTAVQVPLTTPLPINRLA